MNTYEEFRDDSPSGVPVHGFLHRWPGIQTDWLVLTHGAGSNCKAPLLVALADSFCASGSTVLRCDNANPGEVRRQDTHCGNSHLTRG
jgi:uncharacterized protein